MKMRRCEDEKLCFRPPRFEEPCAQTLSGIKEIKKSRNKQTNKHTYKHTYIHTKKERKKASKKESKQERE